jgi:hypothetical protein
MFLLCTTLPIATFLLTFWSFMFQVNLVNLFPAKYNVQKSEVSLGYDYILGAS